MTDTPRANPLPAPRSPSGRKQLLLIVAITVLSLGGSYLLYGVAASGGPWGTTNQGQFVQPPRDVIGLDVRDGQGQPLMTGDSWWLWVVTDGTCRSGCEDTLHQLRQLHVLLNRDAGRVRRALVTPANVAVQAPTAEYPELALLTCTPDSLSEGVYIVDPLGNLVFRYPLQGSREAVLKDLKRLLKVSQIG